MSKHRAARIGVVGLGRCGGNLAAEFARLGYPALAVNTSQTELRDTEGLEPDQRLYLGVEGVNGAGGALAVGADCLKTRGKEILTELADWPELDALLAVGGLGGGTGGNLGGLVTLLADAGPPVIALAVLPASSESHTAKVNGLQGVNDLLDAPFAALVVVDNQRLHQTFAEAGLEGVLPKGNRALVEGFHELNGASSTPGLVAIRELDTPELLHTLLSGGAVVFGSRALRDDLTPASLARALGSVVAEHEVLGSGYEPGDAVVVCAVLVLAKDALAALPATAPEELAAGLARDTDGADVHLSLYRGESTESRVCFMVGGLPLPGRAQALLEEAEAEAARFAATRAHRPPMQKLDLAGLATGGSGRGPFPPSTAGKGMAKIKPAGAPEPDEPDPKPDAPAEADQE